MRRWEAARVLRQEIVIIEKENRGMTVRIGVVGRKETAAKVRRFVGGAHRLAISSESLAGLLGLVESECRVALDALAARGLLRKVPEDSGSPLYCKD